MLAALDASGARLRDPEVSGAALVLLLFALLTAAVALIAPADRAELAAADPLVRLAGGPWLPVAISVLIAAAWLALRPPDAVALRRTLRLALLGTACAALVVATLRLAVGRELPAFIPPEESAKPGLALGLAAGTLEESLFRLAVLPGLWILLRSRARPALAIAVAVTATGLAFAASHELGVADPFVARWFVTRWLFPGCAMSLAFFWPGPAFIVAAHCAAHLLIPLAFR